MCSCVVGFPSSWLKKLYCWGSLNLVWMILAQNILKLFLFIQRWIYFKQLKERDN